MIRVLHSAISCEPGGRREAIATLARLQPALGVRPDLCCLERLGCDPDWCGGIFERTLVLGRMGIFDWAAIHRLAKFCDEREIDVIHAHDAASQCVAALLRLTRPRIKLLMTFHRTRGIDSDSWNDRVRNLLTAIPCGAIVVGSRERRSHFLSENFVSARKIVRIPFGVDVERFRADAALRAEIRRELEIDGETCVFGAAGHFGDEKGIDVVVRAYQEFLRRMPPADRTKLLLLGDGTDDRRTAIKGLTAGLPAGRVILAGYRADIERWFNALDVFVHAPRQEAFGLVVAEAMATRLPVVATAVGGIIDLVIDGRSGLCRRSDDVVGLADAMQMLYCNRDMRDEMGAQSESIARTCFTAELYARRYFNLYCDLLANRLPHGVDDVENERPGLSADTLATASPTGAQTQFVQDSRVTVGSSCEVTATRMP